MLIYLSHEAKEKEWFSPTSPMMPIYLNHEAKVKSPTPPMIKITKHNDANFLIHEGKGKEWLSQFSKKSGYHFVGYQFVEIWLGFQFVGYQFVGYQYVGYQYSAHLFFLSVFRSRLEPPFLMRIRLQLLEQQKRKNLVILLSMNLVQFININIIPKRFILITKFFKAQQKKNCGWSRSRLLLPVPEPTHFGRSRNQLLDLVIKKWRLRNTAFYA